MSFVQNGPIFLIVLSVGCRLVREVGSAPGVSIVQKTFRSLELAGTLTDLFAVSPPGGVNPQFLKT